MKPLFRSPGRMIAAILGITADGATVYQTFESNQQVRNMETTNTFLPALYLTLSALIALLVFGMIMYWRLKDRMDTQREDAHEVMMMLSLIAKRRDEHLLKCYRDGQIYPAPKSWLTDEELRLHHALLEKRNEILGVTSDHTNNNP